MPRGCSGSPGPPSKIRLSGQARAPQQGRAVLKAAKAPADFERNKGAGRAPGTPVRQCQPCCQGSEYWRSTVCSLKHPAARYPPAGAHTLLTLTAVWPQEHLTHCLRYPGPAAGAQDCQHICQHICGQGQSWGGRCGRSLAGQRGTVRWGTCPFLAPLLQPLARLDPGQLCSGFCRGSLEQGAKALGSGLMSVVKRGGRNHPPGIVARGFPLPSGQLQLELCVGEET